MGEVAMTTTGLLSKISQLFNNSLYSDVEFVFIGDKGQKQMKMYGHKLILSLRSKAFSYMFFEKGDTSRLIELPAAKKQSFYLLFRFLYTDDVQFHSFEEAQDLYELASAYAVEELVQKCCSYILQDRLTIKNIFSRYECALKKNIEMLLKDCRDFVCSNTHQILQSENFISACPEVVEDIVQQNNLSVSTELEIIRAVLNWASEDMKRKKIPYEAKNLRSSINRFMKHLRILTLSPSELEYVAKNYDIFDGYESMVLTRKILQPTCDVDLPQGICSITAKRNTVISYSKASEREFDSIKSDSIRSLRTDPLEFVPKEVSKMCYEVKKCSFQEAKVSSSQYKETKFRSSPSIEKMYSPFQPMHDLSQSRWRDFTFPLMESEACFRSSFRNDIKCSVVFRMKSGNFSLHGFELKVKSKSNVTEELEFYVYLQGFSKLPFSQLYKKELNNDVLAFKFPKPMLLKEGNNGELEVSIDNLLLNRCSTCHIDKQYELNNGLNFACEFSLKSNQKSDDGFMFLIHKLIYVPF